MGDAQAWFHVKKFDKKVWPCIYLFCGQGGSHLPCISALWIKSVLAGALGLTHRHSPCKTLVPFTHLEIRKQVCNNLKKSSFGILQRHHACNNLCNWPRKCGLPIVYTFLAPSFCVFACLKDILVLGENCDCLNTVCVNMCKYV